MELATGFGVGLGVVEAGVEVGVDDGVAEGFESSPGGDDLGQHVGAIFVVGDHGLDGFKLTANLAEAGDERSLFRWRMDVFHGSVYSMGKERQASAKARRTALTKQGVWGYMA